MVFLAALTAAQATLAFAEDAAGTPPPGEAAAAPAQPLRHGSRATAADGTTVVYDGVNGVFVAAPHRRTYWAGQKFYRYDGGLWMTAAAVAGPWELVALRLVPKELSKLHARPVASVKARLPSGGEAVFEPRLRAYRVAGKVGVFVHDGRFYRYDAGIWLESDREEGAWQLARERHLPQSLRKAVPVPEAGRAVTLPCGEVVVYDAEKESFVLRDKLDTLLFDGTFYERRGQKWFASLRTAAKFHQVEDDKVPPQVRMKF